MIPFAEAREFVLSLASRLPAVDLPVLDAIGLVLAADIVSTIDVPGFDNSAMDGFAVRSADCVAGSPFVQADGTVHLSVAGDQFAGRDLGLHVGEGEAVRIMTGAPMPSGADAVVMVERVVALGGGPVGSATRIAIEGEVPPGDCIRRRGNDTAAGSVALAAGAVVTPAAVGLMTSVGVSTCTVIRRPVVGVISTGDELVQLGSLAPGSLGAGEIFDSNRPALLATVRAAGATAVDLGHVPDQSAAITAALSAGAASCDLVISSGGVSMGEVDLIRTVMAEIGDMRWMQVAIKPAKPLAAGRIDGTPVIGLPGNPVSSLVSLALLGVPGLRRLAGRTDLDLPRVRAVAGPGLGRRPDGRTAYQRVVCRWVDGRLHAHPVSGQGSHQLSSAADANGLAELPDGDGVVEGDDVTVVLLAAPV